MRGRPRVFDPDPLSGGVQPMKSSNVVLAVVGVMLLAAASQWALGQPAADPKAPASILNRLEVGMHVRILGPHGQVSIEIVDGDELAGVAEISEVGGDYFVVKRDGGESFVEQAIPMHAIGAITRIKAKAE
jgi:hypothetical protein